MPRHLVLQPNGKFAMWSTVVDSFTDLDMTREEAFQETITYAKSRGDYPGGAEQLAKDAEQQLINVESCGYAWDWAQNWNDCIRWLERRKGTNMLAEIDALGLPRRMKRTHSSLEVEKYWHNYWRNRAIRFRDELNAIERHRAQSANNG